MFWPRVNPTARKANSKLNALFLISILLFNVSPILNFLEKTTLMLYSDMLISKFKFKASYSCSLIYPRYRLLSPVTKYTEFRHPLAAYCHCESKSQCVTSRCYSRDYALMNAWFKITLFNDVYMQSPSLVYSNFSRSSFGKNVLQYPTEICYTFRNN